MGLLDQLEQTLINKLSKLFEPVLTPLSKLWKTIKGFFTAIIDLIPETINLVKLAYSEVLAWRSFRQNINFRTGVVNLQSVRDRLEQLISEIVDGWHSLVDLFTSGFKQTTLKPFEDAEEAANELIDLFGGFEKLGIKAFKDIGPKLEKLGGKVFEVLAIVQAVAEELLKVVRELTSIVTAIKDIRETVQTGAGLFLQQTNKRRVVELSDGTKMKIRVGKLHS